MTYANDQYRGVPSGLSKILHFHWSLAILVTAISCTGFLMLYSVAGGRLDVWAEPQIFRFALGLLAMFTIGLVHIHFWRGMAPFAYIGALILLILVEFVGATGMGAQRWIDLGFIQLQPSEVMKIALVMFLALYYDWLPPEKTSRPLWLIPPILLTAVPVALVLNQPDLGTAILLAGGAVVVMFLAGVSVWYFIGGIVLVGAGVAGVILSRGTEYQILQEYQYRRIETFLNPAIDPLGAGYHITQSKIALGSGGLNGRGFMEGTQSRLNFLPEKHTDFIFTTLIIFCMSSMIGNRSRFGALLTGGIAVTFFFFFFVNMAMVMGLAPVVGVPLPLVSYGGSAMLVLMGAFGLIQSAHVHRPR